MTSFFRELMVPKGKFSTATLSPHTFDEIMAISTLSRITHMLLLDTYWNFSELGWSSGVLIDFLTLSTSYYGWK